MTSERSQKLRTAQRQMLRVILGRGRQPLAPRAASESTSSTGSSAEMSEGDSTEVLESWVQWKQRSTREVLQILDKLGISEWTEQQASRYWQWAGHVARRHDGRWSKRVLLWTPQGIRPRGHPYRRWEDKLLETFLQRFGHSRWMRDAQDREKWSALNDC